jgi:hypothetical protein
MSRKHLSCVCQGSTLLAVFLFENFVLLSSQVCQGSILLAIFLFENFVLLSSRVCQGKCLCFLGFGCFVIGYMVKIVSYW